MHQCSMHDTDGVTPLHAMQKCSSIPRCCWGAPMIPCRHLIACHLIALSSIQTHHSRGSGQELLVLIKRTSELPEAKGLGADPIKGVSAQAALTNLTKIHVTHPTNFLSQRKETTALFAI